MVTSPSDRKSLAVMAFVFSLVIFGTLAVSYLARGYQISFRQGPTLTSTGLLSVTSKPKSASVYINDRLTTATDDTLNLPPGDYHIKITKDGYLPWDKDIQIKKEVVFQTDAQLFRSAPDLKPITYAGAINPTISNDGSKVIFAVASASATQDNGLYLVEITDNPLLINKNIPRQISPNYPGTDWSQASFEFSPNSRQFIATFPGDIYLLSLDTPITSKSLLDITPQLASIKQDWQTQTDQIIKAKIDKLPASIQALVSTASANDISFSTSEDKILYLAIKDANLPQNIITPPPAQSTQQQHRDIKSQNYYVYDLKDDTNFLIGPSLDIHQPQWLPGSTNIIYNQSDKIKVVEYDSTNLKTVFAGKFDQNAIYVSADGNKIITLTSAYHSAPENLYAITIR
ncbi:hypothetical protein A2574_01425 [Candidatus Shapirobacteria bacterium RIFOXYD1_FULL_38_32]|uniref:Protein kinase n=3 Tax=Candidatus Shapironibacteriota TaxID=1752721 RepID=A0A0G0JU11_9BACT|nr:MAG: Protein kinase [Candidatus Shapirobacteria bacterium GW2011_GWE2_38_30]KKQ91188.1 MAG: Protein kinase [Candidatus Shapirobacteria bacterium GW2011_GWE1_38_92]OGL56403.1 MAG: hypothetical protein A2367_01390 [Candidatus Shapirobacteria bacterium RIFOXYB1_FULL_38_38]OGL56580.1 MAG: hypothetical protein A2195_00740 [Candidatus Shapirobacteria bacterium RIFOXYA1_FULL_39_17]OGL57767.1 MAG: hypothetical protein A2410_00555 [Candidatus Shapirobacteria bacterium RIFOXYC1_FULL_38_24]OGL58166.1 